MNGRFCWTGAVACAWLLWGLSATEALCAAGSSEDATEEARVWAAEDQLLAKAALEKDGFNPLERSYVGVVLLEREGLDENEKANVETVNVGRFSTKGHAFVLRLASADVLEVLRKLPARKPVCLVGTVRANGKYFVARDVSAVIPGEGSTAPQVRHRRGGL